MFGVVGAKSTCGSTRSSSSSAGRRSRSQEPVASTVLASSSGNSAAAVAAAALVVVVVVVVVVAGIVVGVVVMVVVVFCHPRGTPMTALSGLDDWRVTTKPSRLQGNETQPRANKVHLENPFFPSYLARTKPAMQGYFAETVESYSCGSA